MSERTPRTTPATVTTAAAEAAPGQMARTRLYRGALIITCVNVILHSGGAIQMLNYIGSWLSGARYQESDPGENYIIMKINF